MRVIVGIVTGHDVATVADALLHSGAGGVQGPAASLPDVLVADFPDGDPASIVERVAALPGVRYAEPDELRSTLD